MSNVLTKPFPYERLLQQQSHLLNLQLPSPIARVPRTDLSIEEFRDEASTSQLRFGLQGVSVAVIAVMICHGQAVAEHDFSRPLVSADAMVGLRRLSAPKDEYPVADFYEPLTFEWTESAHSARQAARQFSELSDANY